MKASEGNHRRSHPVPMRHRLCTALVVAMVVCAGPAWAQRNDAPQGYSISAGSLADALDQLAAPSKVQIIYPADLEIGRASCREECVSTCRSRLSPYHYKKKQISNQYTCIIIQ